MGAIKPGFGLSGDFEHEFDVRTSRLAFNPHTTKTALCGPPGGSESDEKPRSRYLIGLPIEGQKSDEDNAASSFLLLKFVSDNVDWPNNENRTHGERCRG